MDSAPARKLPVQFPTPSPKPPQQSEQQKKPSPPRQVKKKLKWFSTRLGVDLFFFFLVVVVVIIGLVVMWSASYPVAYHDTGDSFFYLKKQLGWAVAGFIVMIVMSYFDFRHLHFWAPIILLVAIGALVVVLFMPPINGVNRWIRIGPVNIQPSEIMKFAMILWLAHWQSKNYSDMGTFKRGVLPTLILLAIIIPLMVKEPHFSGIVIILALTAIMMFIGGVKLRYFAAAGIILVVTILVLLAIGKMGYVMERLDGWGMSLTYVDEELWQTTYQTRNSLVAIGSGGFWGLGLGQSRQKFLYIPEVQNDFVFAVVCEELGFIGALVILCIFALIVWRGIVISLRVKEKFATLLGVGLSAQIGLQVILNIMVVTDWLPNTGISLPFFSYGGSSLLMLMMQMGIILSISRTSTVDKV